MKKRDRAAVLLANAHGKVLDRRAQLSTAHHDLLTAVAAARSSGMSLQSIADTLGVSRSRAQKLALLAGRKEVEKNEDSSANGVGMGTVTT